MSLHTNSFKNYLRLNVTHNGMAAILDLTFHSPQRSLSTSFLVDIELSLGMLTLKFISLIALTMFTLKSRRKQIRST